MVRNYETSLPELMMRCTDAFQTCAAWSDLQHAKAWAAKAEEAFTIMRGKNSEDVIRMRKLATKKGPLQHRLWNACGRKTLS